MKIAFTLTLTNDTVRAFKKMGALNATEIKDELVDVLQEKLDSINDEAEAEDDDESE